ncbi:MAG: carbohydrate ABC transporter permease [Christensenellaceae bacterium]|nr:carbohydrate ABC transporter permease [Christensenellaceae bacterium]
MAKSSKLIYVVLILLSIAFLFPIFLVLLNSFKSTLYISTEPFSLLNESNFVELKNYVVGAQKTGIYSAFGYSVFITVFSVAGILLLCSMAAWYITRVKSKFTNFLYYLFIISMVVPFQMVMFTMSKTADALKLTSPVGILVLYWGFGAGLSIFMYSGFVKSVPISLEDAALIDGCNPVTMFFRVVFPVLKPINITIAILNGMWIWNDFLLPYIILGSEYRTLPIAIQYLTGGYGSVDYGHLMAMIIIALIPIVIFYFTCQKYIIEGITSGAVKG